VKPELLIECGTNRGGSSMFYAHLFDLMGQGRVVTIDVEKLHNYSHPRVTYLLGSSTAPEIVDRVAALVAEARGPVMVILDSDHSEPHVRKELDCYARFVTPNSYCLVQDGVIDTHPAFAVDRPGPLPAIESFLSTTTDFEIDHARCERFLITHHPKGWLRRKAAVRP
jgi:cephalosporin hydroxylase